ncbi:MAG: aminomethyl-transferring glycine dehydrogenase subunit GcvPA [Synergistaceae bacterium]|nr:aminomethyl-transferring glycine dehydrogenase subunit GcvPA [Synergistaceae bacterium]
MSYVPSTAREREQMLKAVGAAGYDDLYKDVPPEIAFRGDYSHIAKEGLSEFEVKDRLGELAARNRNYAAIFRGAGAYRHHIPSCVPHLAMRSEFVTAYTPYQAEISQGVLQAIFEYQTTICALTGMDASNASVYDGATAAAEGISMCLEKNRRSAVVSQTANPGVLSVIKTYCKAMDAELILCPEKNGVTDLEALASLVNENTACVYAQTPNFYGIVEDGEAIARIAHAAKARFIAGVNPISLALFKTPGEYGADIAVGDGQPLGIPLSFGGPYLGFMSCRKDMVRKLPGRIIGQTVDKEGKRAFVLTLQAREQHIRREKALSNICTNQALCALAATVYCAALGPQGLYEVACQSMANAAYLKEQLEAAGFAPAFPGVVFHEFVTQCPTDSAKVLAALDSNGILGGLPIDGNRILWCATEVNTKDQIDHLIRIVRSVIPHA